MKLNASKTDPPLGAVLTCMKANVSVEWGKETCMPLSDTLNLTSSHSISRHVARVNPTLNLYPAHILQRTEVDHWLSMASGPLSCVGDCAATLGQLNNALAPAAYLVDKHLTVADIEVFAALYCNGEWKGMVSRGKAPVHVLRWYNCMDAQMSGSISSLPSDVTKALSSRESSPSSSKKEDRGKFVELPGAKMGEVCVRFPPEASGYLHIGHAKAALLNQYYQKEFKGKLVMRFDDTNPEKEKDVYEKVILEDLKLLEIYPDVFTHTSDHFDRMLEMCEGLIKKQFAYCDDTDPLTMKGEREERKEGKNYNNSVEKNLSMWNQMKKGTEDGLKCCVRAKIDMKSNNGCLRDPAIYRCKLEPHVKTGTKYKVYPTYDFACPIVDSVEGITHALRTTEYLDRDDQYFWFIEKLGLRKPYIYAYSRLNMNNTVLSKRKLTWFVDEGLVDGWDDPRFPTVRGIMRHGMTVEGLKDFIVAQGSSRAVNNMEWDKIWSFNKKVIDLTAPRFTALEGDLIPVNCPGVREQANTAQKHPKDTSIGMKTVWVGPKVLIESVDAEQLKEGQNATFINWGNITIKKINRQGGKIVSVDGLPDLTNTDFKKTLKLTFLAETEKAPFIPVVCVYFDHLVNKSVLGKEENFKDFIGHQTRAEVKMMGDPELSSLKAGDIIQIQRKGFFRVDDSYKPLSLSSCREGPIVLFYIPDGHSKDMPTGLNIKKLAGMSEKEKVQSAKGKKAEKSPQEEVKPVVASTGSDPLSLHNQVTAQGDKIRQLKTNKADKAAIKLEVDLLLSFKKQFQAATGQEWKPDIDVSKFSGIPVATPASGGSSAQDIHEKIKAAGDKVRELKTNKADKDVVKKEVDVLLALKKDFKNATGSDWKPDIDISKFSSAPAKPAPPTTSGGSGALAIHENIKAAGDKVRELKTNKADKDAVKKEVDVLLALKKDFKNATGSDWKPDIDISKFGSTPAKSATPPSEGSGTLAIHENIKAAGDKVRELKTNKADKDAIKKEVDVLLALKKDFKNATGSDWKPDIDISKFSSAPAKPAPPATSGALAIHENIKAAGDKVRELKTNKADKDAIKKEVDVLLALKKDFKTATGSDWKPDIDINQFASSQSATSGNPGEEVHNKIKAQGDNIRTLKSAKADKNTIKAEVDVLLALKKEFKDITGKDWIPDVIIPMGMKVTPLASAPAPTPAPAQLDPKAQAVKDKIDQQGIKVRDLKSQGADKATIDAEVKVLLSLKQEYKNVTGSDLVQGGGGKKKGGDKENKKPQPQKKEKSPNTADDHSMKKQTRLGLEAKKEENLSEWYSQVITKSEMIEYYNVSGCYILRPWSYAIWDFIKDFFDAEIKKLGVVNAYFPIFVAKESLELEKEHIADFSPEVAWVTKSGDSDLAEPIAIRPTSETVMYPSYAKWIQSHRDLPMKLNQWNNVVRWEFKQPTPFLRTREFLWQEGHTAFATKPEADEEVLQILDLYRQIYEDLLAIPVVRGKKTEKEKFAGGDYTTTTEAFISASGRAIQGATSHHLGQNFSKMFDIIYEDPVSKEKKFVFQNSWGITTRTIGVMVMVHGDDKGLVLPPRIAQLQVVIMAVGITAKTTEEEKNKLLDSCKSLETDLIAAGVRTRADLRDNVTPAWKFNHWELKGVPLRLELGPREVAAGKVFAVRRDNGEKQSIDRASAGTEILTMLTTIQNSMFQNAKQDLDSHKKLVHTWQEFTSAIDNKNLMLSPFCGEQDCEELIKKESANEEATEVGAPAMGAKSLCIPFDQPGSVEGKRCIHPRCNKTPKYYTLFGRSY